MSNNFKYGSLPIYPHLGMTEAQLAAICEELFSADPVLEKAASDVQDYEAKIAEYERREQGFKDEIRKVEEREDQLAAQAKALDSEKRTLRGSVATMAFQQSMARKRIRECQTRCDVRKRQLYKYEAERRLRALGKELKLGVGRRAGKGLPTEILNVKKTNNEPDRSQDPEGDHGGNGQDRGQGTEPVAPARAPDGDRPEGGPDAVETQA